MAQFQFNATQYAPRYSSADGLPAGKHPVVISASEFKPTKDSTPSDPRSLLALTLTAIDGPAKGGKQTDRLNLQNPNMQTVEIAKAQLSAYCMVTGKQGFNDTSELHNIPFIVEIGPQKNNPDYMEVKGLFFIDGRDVVAGPAQGSQPQASFYAENGGMQRAQSSPFAPAPAAMPPMSAPQIGGAPATTQYPSNQAPAPAYAPQPAPVGSRPPWER